MAKANFARALNKEQTFGTTLIFLHSLATHCTSFLLATPDKR